jgi:hypothetical protein
MDAAVYITGVEGKLFCDVCNTPIGISSSVMFCHFE